MSASAAEPILHGARRLNILLLEDCVPDAQLIEAYLEEAGLHFVLRRAESRGTFTHALSECRFDIILSDDNVPGFEGIVALNAARLACPQAPFVFVTGALGEERAIELLKCGATDYVLKDKLERLAPSVRRALDEAHERAERKRADKARVESERALQTLMGNMPGMAFRCVPVEPWVFEYASPGVVELSGYSPEDFYAGGLITWAQLMHREDVQRVSAEAEAAFTDKRQLTVTYRIRTRSGQEKWVWDRSVGIYTSDGSLEAIEGFVTDITQQREAEAEAKKASEFEKHLIGIVSHDLRNPLNIILLAAASALTVENLDHRAIKSLLRIQSAGERAARMIGDLLDFTQARLGGGIHIERKSVCMKELIRQVVEDAATTHPGRDIRVRHEGESQGEWDPDRLAQAVANLVVNALRYSAELSPVTVVSRGDADGVMVEVHNSGPPIAAELRMQLFQPMQRGMARDDSVTRSVGLGLYIVNEITRGMEETWTSTPLSMEELHFASAFPGARPAAMNLECGLACQRSGRDFSHHLAEAGRPRGRCNRRR